MRGWSRRLVLVMLLLGPGEVIAGEAALRIAVEGSYPPFNEVDRKGKLSGFDVDIANALCVELKRKCMLIRREWADMQEAVLGNNPTFWNGVDAIVSSVSITETRRQTAEFTKKYYQVPARFVRKKGAPYEGVAAALTGKRVGVQGSTTHDAFLTSTFGPSVQIVRYATLGEAAGALRAGQIDLLMADALAVEHGLLRTAEGSTLEFTGPAYNDAGWFGEGVGIAVKKGDQGLVERLNRAIDAVRANGTYGRIATKYFGFDIYGD